MMAKIDVWQRRCRWVLSAFYGLAGILHIVLPKPFLVITPAWVPEPETVIFLTGLCEIAGAVGLLVPQLRKAAAIGLALYSVCVFPANIKHAIDGLGAATASPWQWLYHLVRLPLQPSLVLVALFAGNLFVWPFRRAKT
ncbi:DoxX family protein [Ochrobactrum sp. MYb379]|uniref:DoxX family protein n=1 Tax=Ochrobactrum sp. MYb379 TaxID=2745275 RepID=UPI0030B582E0